MKCPTGSCGEFGVGEGVGVVGPNPLELRGDWSCDMVKRQKGANWDFGGSGFTFCLLSLWQG